MKMNNWKYCQDNSDHILSGGIQLLLASPEINKLNEIQSKYGNYLISHNNINYYIGESKELQKRIKQQFTESTSNFYKNYLKSLSSLNVEKIPILDFSLQVLATRIGRKEIEEFGIVNLQTRLNKFELGKRKTVNIADQHLIWLEVQDNSYEILVEGEKAVFTSEQKLWSYSNPTTTPGIYTVHNGKNDLIYVGESSDLLERHSTHSSTTYFSALRRHIGTEIFGFDFIDDKKRRFNAKSDQCVSQYLNACRYSCIGVNFGRYELEEYLIRQHKPLLNRKENK